MADTVSEVVQGEEGSVHRNIGASLTSSQSNSCKKLNSREKRKSPVTRCLNSTIPMASPWIWWKMRPREEGLELDHKGYQRALEEQRERARKTCEVYAGGVTIRRGESH